MKLSTSVVFLVALALGSTATAGVDEQVVVLFNAQVLELPSGLSEASPAQLLSCNPSLEATILAHDVSLVCQGVPAFDSADTLLTTPMGRQVRMPDLRNLYVFETVPAQRDALVNALNTHSFVVFAVKDVGATPRLVPNDPRFNRQWALNDQALGSASPLADINAIPAWDITQGSSSVSIGIMDPASPSLGGGRVWDMHPDLQGRVSGEMNAPVGEHATVVAGVAAARGNDEQGIAGVDWNAQIVTTVFDGGVQLVDDAYYMISRDVSVVNHSWGQGGSCEYNIVYAWSGALAYKANLLSIVAMPEDFSSCVFPNAYQWRGLNVAATTADAEKADYSHPHSFVDIAAPGGDDLNTFREIYTTSTLPAGDPYTWEIGTSFAAPHVSGAASLLKAYDPSLYNDDIANLIRYSANDVNAGAAPGFDINLGWGILDVRGAIARLEAPYSLVRPTANGGSVHAILPINLYTFIDPPQPYSNGNYQATPVEVRRTVSFGATYAVPPAVWGRGVETVGYAVTNPNFGVGWCEPVGAVSKTGCTLRTYVFDVSYVGGGHAGWFPCEPGEVSLAYSINGIQDLAPPVSVVGSPNGGEVLQAGGSATIDWHVDDEYLPGVRCMILVDLVTPTGTSVWLVAQNLTVGPDGSGSYNWAVAPGMPGADTYQIRVVAQDTNSQEGIDSSDSYFTIEPWSGKGGPPPPPPPCEEPCFGPQRPRELTTAFLPVSPNPFNPETRIRFSLDSPASVTLRVYDVQGRLVANLAEGSRGEGMHVLPWDGTDGAGRQLPSGVYFAALRVDQHTYTQKLMILR